MNELSSAFGEWQVDRKSTRLGAALLAYYLRLLNNDPQLVLAAYYQGLTVTQQKGVLPGSQRYVNGILALRSRGVGQL